MHRCAVLRALGLSPLVEFARGAGLVPADTLFAQAGTGPAPDVELALAAVPGLP